MCLHHFKLLKKHLGGEQSTTKIQVQQTIMMWLQVSGESFFHLDVNAWYTVSKSLDKYSDY